MVKGCISAVSKADSLEYGFWLRLGVRVRVRVSIVKGIHRVCEKGCQKGVLTGYVDDLPSSIRPAVHNERVNANQQAWDGGGA